MNRMRLRARLVIAAALVAALVLVLARRLAGYFGPFVLALLLAAIIDPWVDRLERRGVPRALGAFGVIAALGAATCGAAWALVANLVREAQMLRAMLPEYAAKARLLADSLAATAETLFAELPRPLSEALERGIESASESLAAAAAGLVARAGALPGLFLVGFVALVAAYFLSRDKRELGAFLLGLLPPSWRPEIRQLKAEIAGGLAGFVRAQLILVVLSCGLSVLGLVLIRSPYAWSLGLLAGTLDIVPMVGPSGVFVPLIACAALFGEWNRSLATACVWLAVLMVRQAVEPDVVGRHVGLHPLTTLVSAYLGGVSFGLWGVVVGPVAAIAMKAVCVVSILPHLRRGE